MPEYKLKSGEKVVAQLIESEDENYIYLSQVLVHNIDGSQTYYYRYWIRKSEIIPEKEKAEERVEEEEAKAAAPTPEEKPAPEEKPRRRRRA